MAESVKGESLHCELQLKSKADEVADIFRNKCNLFPTIMPLDVKTVKKEKAFEWLWTFVAVECGSWTYSVKTTGDTDTEPITWTWLDGQVPKNSFDSLEVVYQFSPNDKGCMASAVLRYVRKNALVPVPKKYIEFIGNMLKAVDDYVQTPKH